MSLELSGLNSLAYVGVLPTNPPKLTVETRAPGFNDRNNFNLGDLWVVNTMNQIWILVSLERGQAIWENLFPGGGGVLFFDTENGLATGSGGIINVFGDPNISTSGAGNTVSYSLSNGTNGQLLLGGGANAVWHNLTSTGGSVTYTNGANTLNLEDAGFSGIATSFVTDSGTAVPSVSHMVRMLGGPNINTSGAGSIVTVNLNNNVDISGTLTVTSFGAGVVQTNSSGQFSSNLGTNGQVLISSSIGVPDWRNITSTGGTVTITNGPNTINMETSSSGAGTATNQFLALQTTNLNNVIGNIATFYHLGASAALTVIFDVGGNVFPGNGAGAGAVFTAPTTGLYYLSMSVNMNCTGSGGTTRCNWIIATSNRTYNMRFRGDGYFFPNPGYPREGTLYTYVIADMDSGDTATFQVNAGDVIPSPNVNGIFNNLTSISGYLIG